MNDKEQSGRQTKCSPEIEWRGRIAAAVVLLFCFSLVSAQERVDRSLFKSGNPSDRAANTGIALRWGQQSWNGSESKGSAPGLFGVSANADPWSTQDTSNTSKDTLRIEAGKVKFATEPPAKSPTLAMLLSMVLPGAGQVYVHRYITIPIIWGFGYYFAKSWNKQNNLYHQWSDSVAVSVQADTAKRGSDFFRTLRDFYRDDRDKFAFYIAIVYILNIVDAYVGASLYSFDVSDNLGGSAAIRFRIPIR